MNTLEQFFLLLHAIDNEYRDDFKSDEVALINKSIRYYGWEVTINSSVPHSYCLQPLKKPKTKIIDAGYGIMIEVDEWENRLKSLQVKFLMLTVNM